MPNVVSVDWLFKNLNNKDLVLLDASVHKTVVGEVSVQESITIKGTRFFDLKKNFVTPSSPFPNTIPTAVQFESEVKKLGINRASQIIVFDNLGIYNSPRVWWLFKVMGHENIAVLDGGLPAWIAKGYATTNHYLVPDVPGDFEAKFKNEWLVNYQDVLNNVSEKQFNIVDARSKGRFDGTAPDPRKHLMSGHIPNSISLPYTDLLQDGQFKSESELRAIFEAKPIENEELVYSCGSGLTACIVMLAAHIAGYKSNKLYDGSWTEWAELQGLVQ